ncbi:MAG: glucose-6-phosphate isomerase [Crenarchaeota archaeon]|nr:MAG: glucose-6-phosphate isomerase [Thermoproteota archaeon]RDJ33464.1 MAG: glucose-6-phosphate isomerase [Thermoproteota archaeon]RDJ36548.1 MAG: glucose-6-phosphate isomerase [Thermoproteota archaeon]RDJ39275.1 MAG: glucose-6-phosphate isomerase [Thermoproteota archaeon]
MYKIYDQWARIAEESFNNQFEQTDFDEIDHFVFVGMGGSGAIGDIFSSILSKTDAHVSIVKGYLLPKTVSKNSLVIATSVSGNTVETLNVLDYAVKNNVNAIGFSSGGKLEDFCKKNNIHHRHIDQIHSPRASFTAFLYSMLKILKPQIPIDTNDITESIEQLKKTNKEISSSNLNEDNPSLTLAEWITELPLIYYPNGLQAAAIRFKSSLQENAKIHVIAEDVLEACHNGIVAWENQTFPKPILIQGKNDYVKTKERWKIIKEYFEKNNIQYRNVFAEGNSILSKIIHLVYLLDYASIYRGVLSKIDPSPVKSIDFVKKRL